MNGLYNLTLNQYNHIPDGLLNISTDKLDTVIPGPSLIHLEGEETKPLFISVLLHGNENTGFLAMQSLLQSFKNNPLPRSLMFYIGNVAAAVKNQRFLDGQHDYNRAWMDGNYPEHRLCQEILEIAGNAKLFASIDIHNNTGNNPYYGCVNVLKKEYLRLASLYSSHIVYFTKPAEVQSIAFSKLCPAITIEAGLPGVQDGVDYVTNFLEQCLQLKKLKDIPKVDYNLFHTIGRITVPQYATVGFGNRVDTDFTFPDHFDAHNFTMLPKQSVLGEYQHAEHRLHVFDDDNHDVADDYFSYEEGKIILKQDIFPSMFTKDTRVIAQDCLGYLMRRVN